MSEIVTNIFNTIAILINSVLEKVISKYLLQYLTFWLLHTPDVLKDVPTIKTIYYFFLDVYAILGVLGVVYFAIARIVTSKANYAMITFVQKFVTGIIISIILLLIVPAGIQLSNQFTKTILSLAMSETELVAMLTPDFTIALLFFLLIYIVVLVGLIWYYFTRIISICVLVSIIPIIFFLCIFPKYQGLAQVWVDEFLENLTVPIAHAVILVVFFGIESIIASAHYNQFFKLMLLIALLSFMWRTPYFIRKFIHVSNNPPDPITLWHNLRDLKGVLKNSFRGRY